MRETLLHWIQFIKKQPLMAVSGGRRRLLHAGKVVLALSEDLQRGDLNLRAMSLVYTTLLSLVPLLALSFSLLKALGGHHYLEPLLLNLVVPLGERGPEIVKQMIGFVENVKVGVLGFVGLAFLLYVVVSLVQKIEHAFNTIWELPHERSFAERFSHYTSVVLIGPLFIVLALGITATITHSDTVQWIVHIEPFGTLYLWLTRLMPYLLVIFAFTFIYVFVPNTRVSWRAACIGGSVAGILWQLGGLFFAAFVASSTNYTAVYSSFAVLILFLIWIYLCWVILLLGASVSYYVQHPEALFMRYSHEVVAYASIEIIAVKLMSIVVTSFQKGIACHRGTLLEQIDVPLPVVQMVLGRLIEQKLVAETLMPEPRLLPAKPLDACVDEKVCDAMRNYGKHYNFKT